MSNSIIPSFLPPPYDFTTEDADEYDTEENADEYDTEENADEYDTEENADEYDTEEEYNTESLILYGFVLGLAAIILTNSEVNISFKFSLSKKKTNRKIT